MYESIDGCKNDFDDFNCNRSPEIDRTSKSLYKAQISKWSIINLTY